MNQRTSISPRQSNQYEADSSVQYSTPVKQDRSPSFPTVQSRGNNYLTPPHRHLHPANWDRITWAPKICRKSVSRISMGEVAAH